MTTERQLPSADGLHPGLERPAAEQVELGAVGDRHPVVDAVERQRAAEAAVGDAGGAGDRAVEAVRAVDRRRARGLLEAVGGDQRRCCAPRPSRAAEVVALPAASRATAVSVWRPSAAVVVSQVIEYGARRVGGAEVLAVEPELHALHADGVGGGRGDVDRAATTSPPPPAR